MKERVYGFTKIRDRFSIDECCELPPFDEFDKIITLHIDCMNDEVSEIAKLVLETIHNLIDFFTETLEPYITQIIEKVNY